MIGKTNLIINWLTAEIESGNFAVGAPLPTRIEIMNRFGVARATADKAIAKLRADGHIFGRRGAGTFVAARSSRNRVFLVNPSQECLDYLTPLLNGKIAYEIVQSDLLESIFERITRPGTRIIWDRPRACDKGLILKLNKCVPYQLVINRRDPNLNFITTDTQLGIGKGIDVVHKKMGDDIPWVVVSPPVNPQCFFWAEREVFFYQELNALGRLVTLSKRIDYGGSLATAEAMQVWINELPKRFAVFIPERELVRTFLKVSSKMGLVSGKDFCILMTDRDDTFDMAPGIVALEQNIVSMFYEAATWALDEAPKKLKKLISHKIHKGEFYGTA